MTVHREVRTSSVSPDQGPPAILDLVDEARSPRGDGVEHAGAPASTTGAELGIDLGLALADGEIAPDAGMRLGRLPVMRHLRVERRLGGEARLGLGHGRLPGRSRRRIRASRRRDETATAFEPRARGR